MGVDWGFFLPINMLSLLRGYVSELESYNIWNSINILTPRYCLCGTQCDGIYNTAVA